MFRRVSHMRPTVAAKCRPTARATIAGLPRISLIHTSCDLVTRTAPGAHPIRRAYVYIRHCRATEASAEVRPPKWGDTCSTHTQQQHFLRFRRQCVGPPISIVAAATMIVGYDARSKGPRSTPGSGRDLSYSRRLYPRLHSRFTRSH